MTEVEVEVEDKEIRITIMKLKKEEESSEPKKHLVKQEEGDGGEQGLFKETKEEIQEESQLHGRDLNESRFD